MLFIIFIQNAYKTLSRTAREEERTESYSLLGSGRNPRKALGKNKEGYDSNDESPYTRYIPYKFYKLYSNIDYRMNRPQMPLSHMR